jgi:hypothetical protein
MKQNFQVCLRVSCAVLVMGAAQGAQAQVGSGWISTSLTKHRDVDGCGSISGSTHKLSCSGGSGWQRAEYKLGSSTSGHRQFQGDLKVVSLSGDKISVKQTFKAPSSAFFMLAVRSGGGLYDHGNSGAGTFMSGVIGKTVRVNTTIGGGSHKLYLNGSLKNTRSSGSGSFFDKYGAYKTTSGTGPVTVQWTGVRSWRK